MMGGETVDTVATKHTRAVEVYNDGAFKLHKWHSNVQALETSDLSESNDEGELTCVNRSSAPTATTRNFFDYHGTNQMIR